MASPPGLAARFFRKRAAADRPPASGPRRVLGNFAHLAGGKVAAGVISAVYLLILTRALGAHGYGLLILMNAYAVLMGTVFAYCGFQGVVRYGAIALEAGDKEKFARIVRFMTVVELVMGVLAIAAAAALAPLVGPKLGWSKEIIPFGVLYSLAVIAQIRAAPQGVLQVAERFDLVSAHQVVLPAARLVGVLVVWACGGGLMAYLAVWLAASIVEGLAFWIMALGAWRRLTGNAPLIGPWRGVPAEIAGFNRFTVITKVEWTLRELAPKLAPLTVGWVLGPAAAGAFALAMRGTNLLEKPAGLLSRAIYPVLAAQNARREGQPLWQTVWRSTAWAAAAAMPVVVLLAAFGSQLLPLLGGETFQAGGLLLVLIALSRVAQLAGAPLAAGLVALGRPGRSMLVAIVSNVALYPLLPVLMWKLGLDGAGWHALVTGALSTAALAFYFYCDARVAAAAKEEAGLRQEARPMKTAAQEALG